MLGLLLRANQIHPSDIRPQARLVELVVGNRFDSVLVEQALLDNVSNRSDVRGLILLGELAYRRGELGEAERYWAHALETDPNAVAAMNNLAWGFLLQRPQQLEPALRLAERALKTQKDSAELYFTRGEVLARMGRTKEALADLQFAVAKIPDNWMLQATLAATYEQAGDFELALVHRAKSQRLAREQAEQVQLVDLEP